MQAPQDLAYMIKERYPLKTQYLRKLPVAMNITLIFRDRVHPEINKFPLIHQP
ncbi:hypothetical protein D3C72_2400910 [compost metagenome]